MKNDSGAPVDRLLPGALRARAGAAPGDCLDAETLAAWADEALDARERAGAEAHAADCARCQALLAAMVRSLPPPSAAKSPFRGRSLWWLAALTPVAAALVVWFAVPGRAPVQQSESAAAVDQVAPSSQPAPRSAPPANAPAAVRTDTALQSTLANEPQSMLAKERNAEALERKASPAPPAGVNAVSEPATTMAAAPAPGAAPAASPAPAADAAARREAASAPARASAFADAVERVIVSSNPATRFRLLPGGGVQRSADGGATWRTEVTGAAQTLMAGASPSPSVCWLIGRSGTVLLSTDGRSWRRLGFPETVDLRSVSATDDEGATVTTVDGRAFVTTDGGQTWSRAPGL